jgi:hypothetical protein
VPVPLRKLDELRLIGLIGGLPTRMKGGDSTAKTPVKTIGMVKYAIAASFKRQMATG